MKWVNDHTVLCHLQFVYPLADSEFLEDKNNVFSDLVPKSGPVWSTCSVRYWTLEWTNCQMFFGMTMILNFMMLKSHLGVWEMEATRLYPQVLESSFLMGTSYTYCWLCVGQSSLWHGLVYRYMSLKASSLNILNYEVNKTEVRCKTWCQPKGVCFSGVNRQESAARVWDQLWLWALGRPGW